MPPTIVGRRTADGVASARRHCRDQNAEAHSDDQDDHSATAEGDACRTAPPCRSPLVVRGHAETAVTARSPATTAPIAPRSTTGSRMTVHPRTTWGRVAPMAASAGSGGSVAADVTGQGLRDDEHRCNCRDQRSDLQCADLERHRSIHAGSHGPVDLLDGERVVADHVRGAQRRCRRRRIVTPAIQNEQSQCTI